MWNLEMIAAGTVAIDAPCGSDFFENGNKLDEASWCVQEERPDF